MANLAKGINSSRLKSIYLRQISQSWGSDYVPSILATPREAPSISRAFIITPAKLNGRETHLLSTPELNASLLGLYHPHVVGLQEQSMLSPEARPHPLSTIIGMDKTTLPSIKGVIDVAERLNYLDLLPRVKVSNCESEKPISVVFPWIGDQLWLIQPSPGKYFCINWTVKSKYQDFKRPGLSRLRANNNRDQLRRALARHEIEKNYYSDANIRTIQVADEAIDRNVVANLRQLFLHHRRALSLTEEQQEEILQKYQSALEERIPPAEIILFFVERRRYTLDQCRDLLYQSIWNRKLRVDLFQPILINRPLRPESRDVLEVYADWFRGQS